LFAVDVVCSRINVEAEKWSPGSLDVSLSAWWTSAMAAPDDQDSAFVDDVGPERWRAYTPYKSVVLARPTTRHHSEI